MECHVAQPPAPVKQLADAAAQPGSNARGGGSPCTPADAPALETSSNTPLAGSTCALPAASRIAALGRAAGAGGGKCESSNALPRGGAAAMHAARLLMPEANSNSNQSTNDRLLARTQGGRAEASRAASGRAGAAQLGDGGAAVQVGTAA